MFRDKMVHWAGMLNFFTNSMGTMFVQAKAFEATLKSGFGRRWESTTQERNFEQNFAVRQAYNSAQSRLPVAR